MGQKEKEGARTMKKWLALLLALALVFAFAACSKDTAETPTDEPTQAATEAPASTETPASTPDDTVYKLTLSYYASESIPPGQAVLKAVEYAKEKSNGRLIIDAYFSGTYVSKDDTMASLATGVIDIAPCEATQIASVSTLNQVFNALIQADLPDRDAVQEAYVNMLENIPELNEEMLKNANCFWLYPYVLGGHNLHGNVRVETVEDLKGLKVESHGIEGQYVNLLGGTAVELSSGDYYNAMKLGTVDCQFMHWAVMQNYQVNEVVKYHTIFGADEISSGIMMPAMGYFVNNDTWNELPEDLQQIMYDAFVVAADYIIETDTVGFQDAVDYAHENGHEFIFVQGEDRKPWADSMTPILEDWFADCEAAGYDGKSVYDQMCQLFAG
jgi:TRAP-type C4-dicarboxylate transport system substrate-binding protein